MRVFVREVTVRPGDDLELKNEWEQAPSLEVQVMYRSGRSVGPGGRLVLMGTCTALGGIALNSATTVLDADGHGTFAHVPTATWPCELFAPGEYVPSFKGTIVHDGARWQTLVVEDLDSISGRVVDASGIGQANWHVRLVESSPDRAPRAIATGVDGTFRFDFVNTGASLSVEVGTLEETSELWGGKLAKWPKFVPARETTATPGEHGIEIVVDPR